MKRVSAIIVATLIATLAICVVAGCSGQSASSSAAKQTPEEIIAELKGAIANQPEFKSVTLTEVSISTFKDAAATEGSASGEAASSEAASSKAASSEAASSESAAAEDPVDANAIKSKTVVKFDESGEALKTDAIYEIEDIKLEYYSDGDKAVCVTDGPVYSGTTEQFDQPQFAGFEACFYGAVGDLNTCIDCFDTVVKEQQGDVTVYTVTLDPEKYMASDEILTMMKDAGDPVLSAVFTFSIDKDGRLVSLNRVVDYNVSSIDVTHTLSDFDSTVIGPMPEADKTYEEMESDINVKFDQLAAELDMTDEYQETSGSQNAVQTRVRMSLRIFRKPAKSESPFSFPIRKSKRRTEQSAFFRSAASASLPLDACKNSKSMISFCKARERLSRNILWSSIKSTFIFQPLFFYRNYQSYACAVLIRFYIKFSA